MAIVKNFQEGCRCSIFRYGNFFWYRYLAHYIMMIEFVKFYIIFYYFGAYWLWGFARLVYRLWSYKKYWWRHSRSFMGKDREVELKAIDSLLVQKYVSSYHCVASLWYDKDMACWKYFLDIAWLKTCSYVSYLNQINDFSLLLHLPLNLDTADLYWLLDVNCGVQFWKNGNTAGMWSGVLRKWKYTRCFTTNE